MTLDTARDLSSQVAATPMTFSGMLMNSPTKSSRGLAEKRRRVYRFQWVTFHMDEKSLRANLNLGWLPHAVWGANLRSRLRQVMGRHRTDLERFSRTYSSLEYAVSAKASSRSTRSCVRIKQCNADCGRSDDVTTAQ